MEYVPGEEERLVELVEDVDDEVVVGDGLDLRPRELVVDQDPLQTNTNQSITFAFTFTTVSASSVVSACGGRRPVPSPNQPTTTENERTTSGSNAVAARAPAA